MILKALTFALALLTASAAAAAGVDGVFVGVDAAQGMRLSFQTSGAAVQGVFKDRVGSPQPFSAEALETGAETEMQVRGRRHYTRFTLEGVGLRMVRIPYDDDGNLIAGNAQALLFIREGLELPPRPRRYVEPPAGPGGTMDPEAFVDSYAFWPPEGVAYGYSMVRGRYRTLIRLHALVQADILWKMCQTDAAPAALAEALRGQGVDCRDVLGAVGAAMRDGEAFNRFKADVLAQKQALALAVRCSIDYRRNDPECMKSGAAVAQAAVSLETVKSALSRY